MVEHRKIVGGIERNNRHTINIERTNRAGKLPHDLTGGTAVLTRVLGRNTVHGGGTGRDLNAGVSQPLATAHHITLRIQQNQGSSHDAGGGDVHTGGFKVKSGAQAVHPGHAIRLTQRRCRRAPGGHAAVDKPPAGRHIKPWERHIKSPRRHISSRRARMTVDKVQPRYSR